MSTQQYTPYDDVNQVLRMLHKKVKEVLEKQFTGMYLYGSLSSGDFNPKSSDIDFLVVTESKLSDNIVSKLEIAHQEIWASRLKWASKLEGAYIPKDLIRRHTPVGTPSPVINEGKFIVSEIGSDWIIQRYVVREFGVVLEGPDPKSLIDFVSADDIRNAVMGTLREWWFPMLKDPSWLRNHENGDRAFAVITMCRVMYALEYGTITSKPKATQWARTKLDSQWIQLIDKAEAISQYKDQNIFLDEVVEFIEFTKRQIENQN